MPSFENNFLMNLNKPHSSDRTKSSITSDAITYLLSGGDFFSSNRFLAMVRLIMAHHYAQTAKVDVEQAHRKASPVDNMRL